LAFLAMSSPPKEKDKDLKAGHPPAGC